MSKLRIPKDFLPGFKCIVELKAKHWSKVCTILSGIPEGSGPGYLEAQLSKSISIEDIALLSSTIFSLGSLLVDNDEPEKIPGHLSEAYRIQSGENLTEKEQDTLKERLSELLSCLHPVAITFKAMKLLSESDKVLKDSRIISDIRLLFDDSIDSSERKALIIHSLRLTAQAGSESIDQYLACDKETLENLKTQIERALKKESQIKNDYQKQFPFIEITE